MYILIFAWLWPRAVKVVLLNLLLTTLIKLIVSADRPLDVNSHTKIETA